MRWKDDMKREKVVKVCTQFTLSITTVVRQRPYDFVKHKVLFATQITFARLSLFFFFFIFMCENICIINVKEKQLALHKWRADGDFEKESEIKCVCIHKIWQQQQFVTSDEATILLKIIQNTSEVMMHAQHTMNEPSQTEQVLNSDQAYHKTTHKC